MNLKNFATIAALVLGTTVAANATPISGGIGIGGADTWSATSDIVTFTNPGFVFAGSGSYAGLSGSATLVSSLNDTPGKFITPVVFFQGPDGSELDLDSITSSVVNGNTLTIQGTGTLELDGFTSTEGVFTITSSQNEVSVFEATAAAATPEPASLALFGTGLLGIVGIARRKFNV